MDEAEVLRRQARAMEVLMLARRFDRRIEVTESNAKAWALALGGRNYDALERAVVDYYQTETWPLMVAHLVKRVPEPNSYPFDPENVTHVRLAAEYKSAMGLPTMSAADAYRGAMGVYLDGQKRKAITGPASVAKASGL